MATLGQVIGGRGQQYQGVQAPAPQRDSTGDLLFRMAMPIVQKKLAEVQEQKFAEGMQRVAMDEAYADIKKEDSLLSNIFGPSASVAGAAAMAKVKSVDDFSTQMMQDMQGMAELTPQQFREHAVKGMGNFLTGDNEVDNVVRTKMVESLAPLMKTQAKANYAWTQQQSAKQYGGMLQAAGDKFFSVAYQKSQGLISAEDFELAKAELLQASQPIAGMNAKTYQDALLNSAQLAMNKGNLWVDRVFQQTGVYDGLDAEEQTKIIKARDSAAARVKNEYGFNKYGAAIGELMGGAAGRSLVASHEMANSINERFMAETGAETGLITTTDLISINRSMNTRLYRMQDKTRELSIKANMDAQAEGQLAQQTMELIRLGKGNYAIGMGVPRNKVDVGFDAAFTSLLGAGDAAGALDLASSNYTHGNGYVNPQFQGMLLEPFRQITQGGVPGAEFDRSIEFLDAWASRGESGGAVDAYVGAENMVRLKRYRDSLGSLKDKTLAAQAAWGTPVVKGPALDTKEMKPLMLEAIQDKVQGTGIMNKLDRWWKDVPNMSDAAKDVVFNAVRADAQVYVNNLGMTPKAAIARALEGSGQSSVDIVGAYAMTKAPQQQPLAAMAAMDDQTLARVLPKFLQAQARKQGINVNIQGAADVSREGGRNLRMTPGGDKRRDASMDADAWTNVADLTSWTGGGYADVSLQRARDVAGADGKPNGVFSGLVTHGSNTAVVNFLSSDLIEFYEREIRKSVD